MQHHWMSRAAMARISLTFLVAGLAAACGGGQGGGGGVPYAVGGSPASSAGNAPASPPSSGAAIAPAASPSSPTSVKIGVATSPKLGRYLTAPDGKTLYTLSSDPANESTCAGKCATAWPPLLIAAGGKVTPPTGVMGTFTNIKRSDGTSQVAFDGHPLYTFVQDTAPGQTAGEGIVAFGGTWHVAKAA